MDYVSSCCTSSFIPSTEPLNFLRERSSCKGADRNCGTFFRQSVFPPRLCSAVRVSTVQKDFHRGQRVVRTSLLPHFHLLHVLCLPTSIAPSLNNTPGRNNNCRTLCVPHTHHTYNEGGDFLGAVVLLARTPRHHQEIRMKIINRNTENNE